jgi:hypothetical protein
MKTKFITFGSHLNYIEAGNRLIKQINNLKIFTETKLYTSNDLEKDKNFWDKHKTFIKNNKRGYGYWLWKPYIIKKTIENMKDGDILLYFDCGCEIDNTKKNNLLICFDIVKKDKIVGGLTCIEKDWNKMDLIKKLDMNNDKYINTKQRMSGAILLLVCDETRRLINEWYQIGCEYHYIDDSPSIEKNIDTFKEHRHDQSIFSLLTKKYNLFSNHNIRESILILRNRTGISKINK